MKRRQAPGGYLYAIGVVDAALVKIGVTSGPVATRLRQLQTAYPGPLALIAAVWIPWNVRHLECLVHARLAPAHHYGEWFAVEMSAEMFAQLIADVQFRPPYNIASAIDLEPPVPSPLPLQNEGDTARMRSLPAWLCADGFGPELHEDLLAMIDRVWSWPPEQRLAVVSVWRALATAVEQWPVPGEAPVQGPAQDPEDGTVPPGVRPIRPSAADEGRG